MTAKLLVGSSRCLCRGCNQYFSTVGNFDRHRRNGHCLAPEAVGLVRDTAGVWKRPNTRPTQALTRIHAPGLGANP
jgi:hypothetical protein